MDEVPDSRFQPYVIYDQRFLLWWGIGLFAFKLRSRRQLNYELRDLGTDVLLNLNRLADTRQDSLPVAGTLEHYLGHVGPRPIAELRTKMVRRLLRMRVFDEARVEGHVVVAVDGTGWLTFRERHCEHCLTQRHGDTTTYLHMLQEAKLIGPSGLAISIGTEFIENADGRGPSIVGTEDAKQDCELMALERLAVSLKQDFPQLEICLSSDSLYGCARAMDVADRNHWAYVFTFKEGRMPAAWEEFQRLLALAPENCVTLTLPKGVRQELRWVNGVSYEDADDHPRQFNAIQCLESAEGESTRYAWMTDFVVTAQNVVAIASKGGRERTRIENEGFNMQKNSDFNLEHPYSTDSDNMKAYYYLLQIAHMMLQLFEKGSLLRHIARSLGKTPMLLFGSIQNIVRRLLDSFRYSRISDSAFDPDTAGNIQIRFALG